MVYIRRLFLSGGLGASAPCVFQRLRQVGKALDGELAQLVPQAGLTSAQTDAVIPSGDRCLPSGSLSLKAEFRRNAQTPAYKKSRYVSDKKRHPTWDALNSSHNCL